MLRTLICVALTLVVFALGALAEEYKGKIKSVDADKGTLTVTVGDKDQEFKVPAGAKITAGKREIQDGLKAKLFGKAAGSEVVVVTEKKGGTETVTEVKITARKKDK
jgi:hypothetical protein